MTREIQKYSDPAMFTAQPITTSEPKVQLVQATSDPLGVIALCAKGYQGEFTGDTSQITDDERRHYLNDVRKNVLAAPLEFVHFMFRIEGVTRGFTHQLVRQRTATYVQESTRFAVKETVPVALPPSLAETKPWIVYVSRINDEHGPFSGADELKEFAIKHASQQQLWRRTWDNAVNEIDCAYNALVNTGMPAEDARGLLPTNLQTQVYYNTDLRHLLDHAGLRLCTQAQMEWRLVWREMIRAIREYGETHHQPHWWFHSLADLFKPVCYRTGKCEFMSEHDRYCQIRERVQDFAKHGVAPKHWDDDMPIWPKDAPEFDSSVNPEHVCYGIDLQTEVYDNPKAAMQ